MKVLASNKLLGNTKENDENFSLSPLIINELDVKFMKVTKGLDAEVTAFLGDKLWKSKERKTIIVHYKLSSSKQWDVQGINIMEPIVPVIPRESPK